MLVSCVTPTFILFIFKFKDLRNFFPLNHRPCPTIHLLSVWAKTRPTAYNLKCLHQFTEYCFIVQREIRFRQTVNTIALTAKFKQASTLPSMDGTINHPCLEPIVLRQLSYYLCLPLTFVITFVSLLLGSVRMQQ